MTRNSFPNSKSNLPRPISPSWPRSLALASTRSSDIIEALGRPERDPRDDLPKPIFKKGILKLEDLIAGMELKGTVLNVVDFGAFVDIGLKDSGLVHISQLANRYIKSPHDVVSVGDVVTVWVMSVDQERKRVSLTMVKPGTERPAWGSPGRPASGPGSRRTAGRPGSRTRSTRPRTYSATQRVGLDFTPGRRGPDRVIGRACRRDGTSATATATVQEDLVRTDSPVREKERHTFLARVRDRTPHRGSRPGPGPGPGPGRGGPRGGPSDRDPAAGRPGPGRPGTPSAHGDPAGPRGPSPPPPPLSKEALTGSVPLRTFGQLKQLWEARVEEPEGSEPSQPESPASPAPGPCSPLSPRLLNCRIWLRRVQTIRREIPAHRDNET